MYLNFPYRAMLLTTLALVSACTPKDEGDSDPTAGPGSSSSSSSVSVGESGALTEPIDPDPTDPGDTEPGATDPGDTTTTGVPETTTATDGVVTDTDTDTSGDDTGQALPEECVAADPEVSAFHTLEVVGWPVEPEDTGKLAAPCSVDAVTAGADTVSTALTCEIEGEPHAATLVIAASPQGPVGWAAGDQVGLTAEIWDGGDHGSGRNVQLRAADDALLLSANESYIDENFESPGRWTPLAVNLELVCHDQGSDFSESPLRMDITPVDGPVVSVFSGHRGVVPIDAAQAFAVDVEEAVMDCCHLPAETKVLLRRVNLGG